MNYNEYLEKHKQQAFICHLPCRIGDTVYYRYGISIYKSRVTEFHIDASTVDLECFLEDECIWLRVPGINMYEFGKKIFFDKSEAEEIK